MSERCNLLWFIYLVNLFFVNAQDPTTTPITTRTTTTTKSPPTPPAPNPKARPTEYKNDKFINWLLEGISSANAKFDAKPRRVEYPGYDGWYNNVGQPELGAVDTPLFRRWPAAYEDGVYKPAGRDRPNPLTLSRRLLSGPIGSTSKTGKNALIVFFGQQVVEEILDAQRPACPPEYFNIPIPDDDDPIYEKLGHSELPFLRTRYDARTGYSPNNPRQQLNEITPYIDGGLIYGTSKAWSDVLRTYANGTIAPDGQLASSSNGAFPEINTVRLPMANPPPPINHAQYVKRHYTEPVDRFFKLGNPRGNENPFLLTFGIIWFRWHNYLAKHIKRLHPNWDGETVYNEARKWAIATQQHIIVNDWLFNWVGERLSTYRGYDPTVNPQIDQFFQSAGFRFGHTLVPAGVRMRESGRAGCAFSDVLRTCNNFWMSENALHGHQGRIDIRKEEINMIIMGMAVQPSEREDHTIVEDLRGNVFGPLEFSRRDLMALNVQRARDHGVPDYNTARRAYGLAPVTKLSDFKYVTDAIRGNLSELYKNNLNNIDIWIGGILETDDRPGELFRKIIMDQFERIRNGDRFWYKNTNNGLFTTKEIDRLEEITFYDVLMSVTDLAENDIPKNPFNVPRSKNDIHEKCVSTNTVTKQECTNIKNRVKRECWYAEPVSSSSVENCTAPGSYDYFANSDVSFILTLIGLGTVPLGLIILIAITLHLERKKDLNKGPARPRPSNDDAGVPVFTANEWLGFTMLKRPVLIILNPKLRLIQVKNNLGYLSRALDFLRSKELMIFVTSDSNYVMIRTSHNHDLVLKFESDYVRDMFLHALERFVEQMDLKRERITNITSTATLKQAVTQKDRQKTLEKFFRVVFSQAFHIAHSEDEILQIDSKVAKEVIYTELTLTEFAESLDMRPESAFITKIFNLVDKDKNGFISFREFVDMLVVFLKGSAEDKLKLMFDMYDINGTGRLKRVEFTDMLRSFLETVNADVAENELDTVVSSMMEDAGLAEKEDIELKDFQNLLGEFNDKLSYAELEFNVNSEGKKIHAAKSTFIGRARNTVESLYADPSELLSRVEGKSGGTQTKSTPNEASLGETIEEKIYHAPMKRMDRFWYPLTKYIADKQLQIFWIFLYTSVLLTIFAERAYYYSVEREHSGLRRIAGYGVTITRGAASGMMFTYSTLLLTMCRNTITLLRDTFLQLYIPFDSAIEMHKYVACWALAFTILHVVGHSFNFYHISTQTADDLTCLFPNFFHRTHELPKFEYWAWETMTGVTGMALTIVTPIIFLCSLPIVRKKLHSWFSFTHSLYPVFYTLTVLHGTGRLIQEPFFHYFFLGPVILFVLDRAVTATRKTIEIPILKAELLPSDVTCITFPKLPNFQYKSGQWVRISCSILDTEEYHPFTLSSAPNEPNLTVHIRAVGPWTRNIRKKLDPTRTPLLRLPMIRVDGPYGESHQDWHKYKVVIMVAGGIGVTPFSSILKEIVYKSNNHVAVGCEKVYFLWVTRTQKQFEWMVDILRELEQSDQKGTVSAHIFITQFYQKFDLRTILLYICERHFQKVSEKSLLTGLKAVTHFGRPKFKHFFSAIRRLHPDINTIGVLSCGTPSMSRTIDAACTSLNISDDNDVLFRHRYQIF